MGSFGVAFLVIAVIVLLYLYSPARRCIKKLLPWAALLGIGFVAGLLFVGGGADANAVTGGGKVEGGAPHESLDEEEDEDAELEAFLAEEGDKGRVLALEEVDLTDGDAPDGAEITDLSKLVEDIPPAEEPLP